MINLAQRIRPDLVALDLIMPGVSSFDVVEALRRNADTAHTPILVLTAKQIAARDRAALNRDLDNVIRYVEESGFDKLRVIAEVRRALLPKSLPH